MLVLIYRIKALVKLILVISLLSIFMVFHSFATDVNTVIKGLENYINCYNNHKVLALTYKYISESPPQSEEEAERISLQQIRSSSKRLFGQEYDPSLESTIQKYIEKIDFEGMVNHIKQGAAIELTIQTIYKDDNYEYIVINEDGSLMNHKKYYDGKLQEYSSNPILPNRNKYIEKTLFSKKYPKQNIYFLFDWCSILEDKNSITMDKINENTFRLKSRVGEYIKILKTQKKEDYFIPLEYVLDKKTSIEITNYRNYVNQGNIMIPGFILIDMIPKENATDLSGLLGPLRWIYVLE